MDTFSSSNPQHMKRIPSVLQLFFQHAKDPICSPLTQTYVANIDVVVTIVTDAMVLDLHDGCNIYGGGSLWWLQQMLG